MVFAQIQHRPYKFLLSEIARIYQRFRFLSLLIDSYYDNLGKSTQFKWNS